MKTPGIFTLIATIICATTPLGARVKAPQIGVVNGLSVFDENNKGHIMPLHAELVCNGSGEMKLRGYAGDEFKESAQIAFEYAKAHAHEFGVDPEFIEVHDILMHLPRYHVDGDSAGVAMLCALMSAYTERPLDNSVAVTGALSKNGRVHAIGKLKQKMKGAYDDGVFNILAPAGNRQNYKKAGRAKKKVGMTFVSNAQEVLRRVLMPEEN